MKGILGLSLAAVGLLASDHSGVRPRGAAKDYPHTIAQMASLLPQRWYQQVR